MEKMSIEGLHTVIHHFVGLMERAEARAENGHKNAFKYLPKYSVLLKRKLGQIGQNKRELIEMIKVLDDDSYVRMLEKHEEMAGMNFEAMSRAESEQTPISIEPSMSPMSPMSTNIPKSPVSTNIPKSPSLFNSFNLARERAAKKAKKGGATRKQTKRSRLKRRK